MFPYLYLVKKFPWYGIILSLPRVVYKNICNCRDRGLSGIVIPGCPRYPGLGDILLEINGRRL